uniref:Peroxidase n=1 Tax=Timema monikensis TaxID=170555 RepID=A0A7R9E0V1_9NEOP|nr:unnamed protein product [Timema monikensis]
MRPPKLVFALVAPCPCDAGHTQHLHPPVLIDPLPSAPKIDMPHVPPEDMTAFVARAQASLAERFNRLEPDIYRRGVKQVPGTPAWFMGVSRHGESVSRNMSRVALVAEEATKYIVQAFHLSRDQVNFALPAMDMRATPLGETCPLEVDFPCQPRKYRAYSGHCNNVQSPHWGTANTRYLRFLPPRYEDGVGVPRSQGLPSPREVSLAVHRDADLPHAHLMALTAVWGEFVAHDVAHTPQMSGFDGSRLKCCSVNFSDFHPECFPIRLPERDPVHGRAGDKCQEYSRSASAPRTGCTLGESLSSYRPVACRGVSQGPREQLNQVTSFMDASMVYGSSNEQVSQLRAFSGGQLTSQRGPSGTMLLPPDKNTLDCRFNGTQNCFLSGDWRANEHSGLAALHTLWLREHNRLAGELHRLNPHWGDETLFQEARRIVAAEIQHVTYSEFLPVVLGQMTMDRYGLQPQASGFFTGYDINLNAGMANGVAAAALWFVASLMPKTLTVFDRSGKKVGEKSVSSSAYAPSQLYERGGAGLDLAAQVIQQGRDHGLPGYTHWRQFCGLSLADKFQDLTDVMPLQVVSTLSKVYRNVSDIDLFTGGLAETPTEGSVVGPTFGCLLGRQFHYLRLGDRYWYENDLPPSSFTKGKYFLLLLQIQSPTKLKVSHELTAQLNELRKVTLARIICDNSDNINEVQPSVFLDKDPFLNAMSRCSDNVIQRMGLTPWSTTIPHFSVSSSLLADAMARAKKDVSRVLQTEIDLWEQKRVADPLSPVGTAFGFNRPKRQAQEIANTSLLLQFASARFVSSYLQGQLQDLESARSSRVSLRELVAVLPNIDLSDTVEIPRVFRCDEQTLPCDHTSRYRTITGWCNNLRSPELGKSLRAFVRLLPPAYHDGEY